MIHFEEKDKTEEANSSVTEPAPESREVGSWNTFVTVSSMISLILACGSWVALSFIALMASDEPAGRKREELLMATQICAAMMIFWSGATLAFLSRIQPRQPDPEVGLPSNKTPSTDPES
ncbi:hypothetical protein CEP54_011091 [Fusarium duplospermum]|uniref:Uncharacterized protein n=1 Tax=Fusarium duplospermum TaxID=1325734 RepID=A0A428PGC2_9HYPO|nr:hypothetical protein CEP54_011091 [Fusarium duplospermum]